MQNGRTYGYMLSEQELIEGCRKGDSGFQQALYQRFCRKMMVVCLRYSRSTAEAEDILQLLEMIQALPQGCQVVFNLFAIEGYNHKEIAELLGISEGTSKSQYARARSLLQAKLLKESTYYERYGEGKV